MRDSYWKLIARCDIVPKQKDIIMKFIYLSFTFLGLTYTLQQLWISTPSPPNSSVIEYEHTCFPSHAAHPSLLDGIESLDEIRRILYGPMFVSQGFGVEEPFNVIEDTGDTTHEGNEESKPEPSNEQMALTGGIIFHSGDFGLEGPDVIEEPKPEESPNYPGDINDFTIGTTLNTNAPVLRFPLNSKLYSLAIELFSKLKSHCMKHDTNFNVSKDGKYGILSTCGKFHW